MSDYERAKTIKNFQDEKDYKSARFWGILFWLFPTMFIVGMYGFLGPIVGSLLAIPFFILCFNYKTRIYMYFIFGLLTLFLAFTGAFGGIVGGIFFSLLLLVGISQNYQYMKMKQEVNGYEKSLQDINNLHTSEEQTKPLD